MQVVYKEIACDEGKSIKAKWNLIGRVQFKHMKNCLKLTCSAMIGYVLIRLWMFFSKYAITCKFFGVCIVRKGVEKHTLT